MSHESQLLSQTVQLTPGSAIVMLNSAASPFVPMIFQRCGTCTLTLAEDNISALQMALGSVRAQFIAPRPPAPRPPAPRPPTPAPGQTQLHPNIHHVPFHEYMLHEPPATMDVAIMNLLYQPGNAWVSYGLHLARYALKVGGKLYVVGAKDRGILSVAKRMDALFGNVETLEISKGSRVVRSLATQEPMGQEEQMDLPPLEVFARGTLDEGTRLLMEALEVRRDDDALDIGCAAGIIGLHIAGLARQGQVTMVEVSLAAVALARRNIAASGLSNIRVLSSDGAQAVLSERFDLVVTNPPFHQGGIQTTALAERFIREAAQVLRPHGRFYLVANRFLKYEPFLRASFRTVREVGGDSRYKVLCSTN
jgi:16S rRNA (guanine1207-N2)-methyltransferase